MWYKNYYIITHEVVQRKWCFIVLNEYHDHMYSNSHYPSAYDATDAGKSFIDELDD